jgi:hypothetical protein
VEFVNSCDMDPGHPGACVNRITGISQRRLDGEQMDGLLLCGGWTLLVAVTVVLGLYTTQYEVLELVDNDFLMKLFNNTVL